MTARPDLTIYRGAVCRAVAWVIVDEDGVPARSPSGLNVVAKVRAYRGAADVLHTFACSVVLVTLPGQYDDQPVALAQINELTPAQTAALEWDRGVFDVLVAGDVVASGRVTCPQVVSRA